METKMSRLILLMILTLPSMVVAQDFKLKLHKVVNGECRIMFFESADSKEFFLEKFSIKDNRKYSEYTADPVAFMKLEKPRFGYQETLGHESKNHIVFLIDRDVILKYEHTDVEGNSKSEEVALFQNVSCE